MVASANQNGIGGRRVPWGLVGMLVLVLLTERFINDHKLRFSRVEPDDWAAAAQVATSEMPAGGVILLGDSQVKFGLSPLQIEASIGQPVQCLAVQGGQAPTSYLLLRKALQSGAIPSAIVVDFEPHLLRDFPLSPNKSRMWAELATLPECFELAETMGSAREFAELAACRLLPSVRDRLEVRANLMAAFRGEILRDGAMIAMSRRNRGMNRGAILMPRDLGDHSVNLNAWGNRTDPEWAPDPVNDRYARRLLRLALDHKIPVYLPLMPTGAGIQAKYEQNNIDSRYVAWVQRLQERFPNLHVLDWRHSRFEPTAFLDALHLNGFGAASTSAVLGDHLRRVGSGQIPPAERWSVMPAYQAPAAMMAVEDTSMSDAVMRGTARLRR